MGALRGQCTLSVSLRALVREFLYIAKDEDRLVETTGLRDRSRLRRSRFWSLLRFRIERRDTRTDFQ